jgi:hypothetical protein
MCYRKESPLDYKGVSLTHQDSLQIGFGKWGILKVEWPLKTLESDFNSDRTSHIWKIVAGNELHGLDCNIGK